MKAVKWGIVGIGEQARTRMIPALKKIKGIEICAVCCSDSEKARKTEAEFKVKGYGKLAEFLSDPEIDVVYIATPHHLHTPQAYKAIEAGKNVLVEKPMALSVDGVHKIIEAARRKKVKVGAVFPLRHHPGLRELQDQVRKGNFGELVQVSVYLSRGKIQEKDWRKDQFHSGPMCLMDLGLQGLDLLLWMAGKEAQEISALGKGGQSDDQPNTAVAISVNFETGMLGMVSAHYFAPGTIGLLFLQGTHGQAIMEMHWPEGDGVFKLWRQQAGVEEEKHYGPMDLYQMLAENFNLGIQGKINYSPSCEESYSVVEACCGAIESLKTGKVIKIGEIQRISAAKYKEPTGGKNV